MSSYESTGHLAVVLRVPVATVEKTVSELNIQPDLMLNGTRYYSRETCERLAEEVVNGTRVHTLNGE